VLYVLFAVLAVLITAMLWRTDARLLPHWSQKGGMLERMSPIILFLGAVLGLLLGRAYGKVKHGRAWGWYGFGALLVFLFMEEIGWGYDVLHYPRPEIGGIPVDSLHDSLRLLRRMENHSRTALFQMLGAILTVGIVGVAVSPWGRMHLLRSMNPNIVLLIVLSIIPIIGALLLDARLTDMVGFLRRNPPYGLEELVELLSESLLVLIVVEGWTSLLASRSVDEPTLSLVGETA
jgi:hypothetical protein